METTMELDVTRDITVEPYAGGCFVVRQYNSGEKRSFQRAFSNADDLLAFLALAFGAVK
jgi:hypothetical protein